MGKEQWSTQWLKQIGVCVGYALAFLGIHAITSAPAHWHLNAGLEVIGLLLVPYRYWAALLVGEAIPNAYVALQCLADFGPTWVAIRMIPEMLFCMPVVWLCRSKLNIFPTKHLVNIKTLLVCVSMVSIVLSAYSYILISTLHITSGPYRQGPRIAGVYLAGNYTGLLTLVPWALIIRLDFRKGRFKERLEKLWSDRLLADSLCLVLPIIAFMAWVASKSEMTQATVIEMAMFIPAAWLTSKHGWRAAALAGTMVVICNGLLQPDLPITSNVVEITLALSLAVSALYALGAKVTAQNLRIERERQAAEAEQQMVRQNLAFNERRMRRAAERLEFVAGSLHVANNRVLDNMRRIVPNIESHGFYKQTIQAHEQVYRLAESLHPSAWRDRGVPAALNETIARALDEAGMTYSCEMSGRGFTSLEPSVQTAIYRTACEAIVHAASHLTCSRIRLEVRAGETHRRRWVVIRVDGIKDHDEVAKGVYYAEQRRDLSVKLGTHLTSIEEMRSHAQVFGGQVHLRVTPERIRVAALLHSQAAEVRQQRASAPLHLWVD